MARTCGWLVLINLAAWSLGLPLERILRCPSRGKEFRVLYRLGLGFATLSVLTLALAAVHALRSPVLRLAILVPAAVAAAA